MKNEKLWIAIATGAGVAALTYALMPKKQLPEGATAAEPFDKHSYLGTWNEVARMPSFMEKDFQKVIEEYSLNDDGTIKVVTKAYNAEKDKWSEFAGTIKFAGAEDVGTLKVSYFRPVYFAYNVLEVDAEYQYALVSTSNLDYLWILSRKSSIPDEVKEKFLNKAKAIGFEVEKLEWV